jgi:hypothetical protein
MARDRSSSGLYLSVEGARFRRRCSIELRVCTMGDRVEKDFFSSEEALNPGGMAL